MCKCVGICRPHNAPPPPLQIDLEPAHASSFPCVEGPTRTNGLHARPRHRHMQDSWIRGLEEGKHIQELSHNPMTVVPLWLLTGSSYRGGTSGREPPDGAAVALGMEPPTSCTEPRCGAACALPMRWASLRSNVDQGPDAPGARGRGPAHAPAAPAAICASRVWKDRPNSGVFPFRFLLYVRKYQVFPDLLWGAPSAAFRFLGGTAGVYEVWFGGQTRWWPDGFPGAES